MISIILVVLVNLLGKERYSIANEEMRDVHGQRVVDATLAQLPINRFVVHYVDIVVSEEEEVIFFFK